MGILRAEILFCAQQLWWIPWLELRKQGQRSHTTLTSKEMEREGGVPQGNILVLLLSCFKLWFWWKRLVEINAETNHGGFSSLVLRRQRHHEFKASLDYMRAYPQTIIYVEYTREKSTYKGSLKKLLSQAGRRAEKKVTLNGGSVSF